MLYSLEMSRSHSRQLDQFYTDRALALDLSRAILARLEMRGVDADSCRFLEPSGGEGAFIDAMSSLDRMLDVEGCDIDPKHPQVTKGDFFSLYTKPAAGRWVVYGNPPFGKNAMLAVKFFNHAATFADTIAFIVPRTFEKTSLQNRLDPHFDLAQEIAIDPHSFHFNGNKVAVPCVFQIWERLPGNTSRSPVLAAKTHSHFRFLKTPEGAAFAFQRVGVQAGRTKSLDAKHLAPPSHYFIAANEGVDADAIRRTLDAIDWAPIKARTAGNPSIGKGELVEAYIANIDRSLIGRP